MKISTLSSAELGMIVGAVSAVGFGEGGSLNSVIN